MRDGPPPRLSFVFAKEAPIAVVLRRGPSRWVQVLKWRTDSDKFEDGAWFHGKLYGERCGLSPNGMLFLYFAYSNGKVQAGYEQTYTAISKVPWLTALALWPHGDTWGGGGRFIANDEIEIGFGAGLPHHPDHSPNRIKVNYGVNGKYDPCGGLPITYQDSGVITGEDQYGKGFVAKEGKIFRIKNKKERMIRDFNYQTPSPISSPLWAKHW